MLLTKDESKYCKCISNMTNIWINPKADDTVLLVYALLFCNFFLPFFPLRKVCIMNCYRGVTKGCPTVLRIHILNPDPAKNLNLDPERHWIRIRILAIFDLFLSGSGSETLSYLQCWHYFLFDLFLSGSGSETLSYLQRWHYFSLLCQGHTSSGEGEHQGGPASRGLQ